MGRQFQFFIDKMKGFSLNDWWFSEHAASHVEGGQYVGPEFLLGQVYDGNDHNLRWEKIL